LRSEIAGGEAVNVVSDGDPGRDFEAHRDHLMSVAYRMLGNWADAEDAVQEAWLRYAGSTGDLCGSPDLARGVAEPIRDLRAWLTTVTGRICLDVLRSARARREAYVGPWLPEPVITRLPGAEVLAGAMAGGAPGDSGPASGFAPDPAERAARTDQLSLALLVVLERLTPEQRVAFVLHDIFAVPFDEIAKALGSSPESARQLASRARRAVAAPDAPKHTAGRAEQRRVLAAFLTAVESGDLDGLLAVLAPEAILIGDGGGLGQAAKRPIVGALQVARFLLGLVRRARKETARDIVAVLAEPVLVNGDLGVLVEATYVTGDTARLVIGFAIAGGRVTAVFHQLNPAKLDRVPATDPTRAWHLKS
jgi:RNA polymerase sigma-70 factor (ECF subfamily)